MSVNAENLVWIDLEMTGLDTVNDQIIEIATVVTDKDLNILAEGPELAIHQSEEILAGMDEWNTRQHGESGLTSTGNRVLVSGFGKALFLRLRRKKKHWRFFGSMFPRENRPFVATVFVRIGVSWRDACQRWKIFLCTVI